MVLQSTIDKVIDRAAILDVVSEYVTLRRSGASYKGLCPFHDDTTPSFYVSPAKGLCKCFSCGKGGNAVHFIMEMEQLSFIDAIKFLGKKYGIEVEEKELTPEERRQQDERESMFALNEWACNHFHDNLSSTIDGKTIGMAYFRSRGIRDDIIDKFRLGFALKTGDAMSNEALRKGFKTEFLQKTGLAYQRDNGGLRDKFAGRVIFPWLGVSGKVIGFGGRVLDSRTKGVVQKYVNSPDSDIYHKGNELYGIFQAKKAVAKEDHIYMVEGYTDVISMHQCGIENVVANSGTALSREQIRLMKRFTNNITLLYDGDVAGIHAAIRGTDMLLEQGMRVKILLLPDGEDPDSFASKHNATEFREYIQSHQTDFITFKTNLLLSEIHDDPIKKTDLINDIVSTIAVIPEEINRSVYIHQCAEMLKTDEAILLRAVARRRRDAREEQQKERERERERTQTTQSVQPAPDSDQPASQNQSQGQSQSQGQGRSRSQGQLSSLTSQLSPLTSKFAGLEQLIMRIILRYGNRSFDCLDAQGETITISVIDYVLQELSVDGLQFQTPLYRRMLSQLSSLTSNLSTLTSNLPSLTSHLLSSPDVEISKEAANLLSDRYQLSAKGAELDDSDTQFGNFIVHLMLDYKYAVVADELKKLQAQLSDPAVTSDFSLCSQLLKRQLEYSAIKRQIAKRLGERVLG